jgi:hypothetical protein
MSLNRYLIWTLLSVGGLAAVPGSAAPFQFSTGNPDGLIATATRPTSEGKAEIESADDFVLDGTTKLTGGTFAGLLPTNLSGGDVRNVIVEIYRVFPLDSQDPPSGRVPTRVNSPSDLALATRDASAGELTFNTNTISPSFTAANSVQNGINPVPNQFTGGEGSVTGQETEFSFNFATAVTLAAGHYFFVPQVELTNGDFFWLSAPKPIAAPGTPFNPDLQSWIRNENLAPDWLRIGTDITHQGPFNAAFSLVGEGVPEPASWSMMVAGFGLMGWARRRRPASVRPFVA